MPYISVKTFPKNKETKEELAEQLLETIQKTWNVKPEWVTIAIEDVAPEAWDEQVMKAEIQPKMDSVLILDGKKLFKGEK